MPEPATAGPPVRPIHLTIGPTTRERAARVLEQQLGAVWAGILESHGYDPEAGWVLVVGDLSLVPQQPEGNGRP